GDDADDYPYLRESTETDTNPFGPYFLPHQLNRYTNVLGKIDYDGLLCTFVNDICTNKYGYRVVKVDDFSEFFTTFPENEFGRNIYYYDGTAGPFIVNSPWIMRNDLGSNLLILNSDLIVQENIEYGTEQITGDDNINRLSSIGFLVKGNITVDPSVTHMVGVYIALGEENIERCPLLENPPGICSDDQAEPDNFCDKSLPNSCSSGFDCLSCGRITSGSSSTNQLQVNGLMMARQFNFQRGLVTVENIPSENITFDGRAIVNPPPGLEDFTKALPVIREVTP
ncbi:MAG: hypothetical protein ACD_12C00409G0001, partial [uncultured bacterium]